jgi:hypothetical protein
MPRFRTNRPAAKGNAARLKKPVFREAERTRDELKKLRKAGHALSIQIV